MQQVPSPVTGSNSLPVDSFRVSEIIKGYKEKIGLDVSSYYKGIDNINLYECPDTKLRFFYPSALAGNDAFYTALETRDDYYNEWKWDYEVAFPLVRERAKVLDVGCGRGAFLDKLKKEKNCNVHGLEFNPSAYKVLLERNISAEMKTIEQLSEETENEFDYVCSFQVLEHIPAVKSFLESSIKVLKKGGKLITAVPNNQPYLFGFDRYHWLNLPPHHMNWWNAESLANLTKTFPISVDKIVTNQFRDYNMYLNAKETNIAIEHPQKLALFRFLKPFYKQWIQIARNTIPPMYITAVYTKN